VSGVLIRNGLQCKYVPKSYGPHKTLYNLPQCGSFLKDVRIVSSLWPVECRLQKTPASHAARAAISLDLVLMDGENFDKGEIIRHSASFL